MPRSTISPEIKAAAMADLHNGDQPAIVAERYGIDRGLIKMWKQRYVSADVSAAHASSVSVIHRPQMEAQQLTIGELVIDNLRAKLLATERIATYASTPAWLDKQTAADVAELFEVLDRAAVSVLDRLAQRRSADDSEAETSVIDAT